MQLLAVGSNENTLEFEHLKSLDLIVNLKVRFLENLRCLMYKYEKIVICLIAKIKIFLKVLTLNIYFIIE